jgi:hypothetical protein
VSSSLPQVHPLSMNETHSLVERFSDFFKSLQPIALDLYANLDRWMPCIQHYHVIQLPSRIEEHIEQKIAYLMATLQKDFAFNPIELNMVRAVASWGLPFLKKQGFHDAIDHSIKVALSSISLCRYLEVPRPLHVMSILVSLLHDPKINVDSKDQMAMLVSHPSLASALLTIFMSPRHSEILGASCILPDLKSLSDYYKVPPEQLGVSGISALMENLDSGYVVEWGFVRSLTQLHLEKSAEENPIISEASPHAIQNALELAEYIRMQYLTQLFCTYDSKQSVYISPIQGVILDNPTLTETTKQIYIRSGFPHMPSLPLSDVFTSHMQIKESEQNGQLLGAILGASDNGQLNGYKVLCQSVTDHLKHLRKELISPSDNALLHWKTVLNHYKVSLPCVIEPQQISVAFCPQLMIDAFSERVWRSVVENYLYLKGNVSNLVALHYIVREGVAFLATIQRYGEQKRFGYLSLESRFGDFITADTWTECLEEITYDEEFLFLLYRELDHWFESKLIRWPDGLELNLVDFIELYKHETEFVEIVLPLIPMARLPEESLKEKIQKTPPIKESSFLNTADKVQIINKNASWTHKII